MAPHAYVMEKRVAAAKHLLITEPELTVQEVALQVGFGVPAIWDPPFGVKPDTPLWNFDVSNNVFTLPSAFRKADRFRTFPGRRR